MYTDDDPIVESWGPFQISTKWVPDDYPDLSWLGEYTDRTPAHGLYVDRKVGMILSPESEELQLVVKWSPFRYWTQAKNTSLTDEDISDILAKAGFADPGGYAYGEYDPDAGLVAIYCESAYKILFDRLPKADRGEYRYFLSGNDYTDMAPMAAAVCIAEDYRRMESYNRGNWGMVACVVTVTLDGREVGGDSLWGIESDCGADYEAETVREVIAEAKRDTVHNWRNLRDNAATFLAAVNQARDFLANTATA